MNIFIVEDEPLYADQLQVLVEQAGHTVCGVATNSTEALLLFENSGADLALVDINLSGMMDGLELGKWLSRFKSISIIFITAHYDDLGFFERAKQLGAYAFLKKPIDVDLLLRTIDLALQQQALTTQAHQTFLETAPTTLLIKIKTKYIKVNQSDITFITAEDKYCAIHLQDGTVHLERTSLKDLNKKLSPQLFAQTHRSYIVNLQQVQETDVAEYTIKVDEQFIPLGETYRDYFLHKFGL